MIEYNIGISRRILAPFGTGKKAFGGFNGYLSGDAVGEKSKPVKMGARGDRGGKRKPSPSENAS